MKINKGNRSRRRKFHERNARNKAREAAKLKLTIAEKQVEELLKPLNAHSELV